MFLKKFEVKDKTALVTGAGKGIGKSSAIALAEAGANLIIISRTEKDLIAVKNQIKKIYVRSHIFICKILFRFETLGIPLFRSYSPCP